MKRFFSKTIVLLIAVVILIIAAAGAFFLISLQTYRTYRTVSPADTTANKPQIISQAAVSGAQSISQDGSSVILKLGKDILDIQVCSDDIIRLHYLPGGKSSEPTLMLDRKDWQKAAAEINLKSDPAVIKTARMKITVSKSTGKVTVTDSANRVLVKEAVLNSNAASFSSNRGTKFYGMAGYSTSDRVNGILKDKSYYEVKAGAQGYAGGPFLWSTSGFGFLIDSDGGRFNLAEDGAVSFTKCSRKDKEAYIMVGKPEEIMSALAEITGRTPMFPKWALGFTNSEWGLNQKELLDIVNTYRAKNIPIDNYTLDFDWKSWGEDNYGEFRWNAANFPDGASGKLAQMLREKGVKLTGIMKPRIHKETVQGKFVTDNNWWLKKKGFSQDYFSRQMVGDLDFSIEAARKWFYGLCKKAMDTGFVGWWNDEADENSPNFQFLNMQRALYEGQRSDSNRRVWSLNRNFYLGAQRYAYGMWSGDIQSGFASMKAQRDVMLSTIGLGQAKWSNDTGGFSGGEIVDPENYARWMEFSAFTPIFRVHGSFGLQRQPWVAGKKAESAAVKAIKTRYRLIPYIYSYERKAYEKGVGIVKPLIFDYPDDEKAANFVDGWMFGDYMYVSPVVDPGVDSKDVYLPKGTWYDYERGTKYQGGNVISYGLTKDSWDDIPVFIKEGAIIPSQDVMNFIGEKPVTNIFVDVFPSINETGFTYYDDDGETYDYEKGISFKQVITQQLGQQPSVTLSKPEGSYKPETKYYIFRIHGDFNGDVSVNSSGLKTVATYNALMNENGECAAKGSDIYGKVTYIKVAFGEAKEIKIK